MPQVQKDDVRETILESAREEFLEHGFEGSSMRRIALRSKMTVGNLYRYFKNKEELSSIIVSPTLKLFDDTVRELSGGLISMGRENGQIDMPLPLIKERLSTMSDRLVDIYDSHRIEVSILMMGTELNKKITDWFADLIAALIAGNFGMLDRRDERLAI
ncbi:MAG: helix-turn-helix transcriptional regulator, partial [Firmicutes bacterium]|nr:helix-turn-helix transcriptional regulator [Bacillota bacterium]